MARICELVPHMKDLETPDTRGRTALHRAAEFGQAECVALLLRYGAKVRTLGALGNPWKPLEPFETLGNPWSPWNPPIRVPFDEPLEPPDSVPAWAGDSR